MTKLEFDELGSRWVELEIDTVDLSSIKKIYSLTCIYQLLSHSKFGWCIVVCKFCLLKELLKFIVLRYKSLIGQNNVLEV